MLSKYNRINLLKRESTPQVAKANRIEKTATTTIRLEAFSLFSQVTLPFNSSNDSFMYVNIVIVFSRTDGEASFDFAQDRLLATITFMISICTGGEASFDYAQDKLLAFSALHGRRGSNSRHLVLETSALPTELRP